VILANTSHVRPKMFFWLFKKKTINNNQKTKKIFKIDPLKTRDEYCHLDNSNWSSREKNVTNEDSSLSCGFYQSVLARSDLADNRPQPNIALLSLILLIGTCCMALSLKKLRRSIFLGAVVSGNYL
jgi:hypothetical protein